MEKLNKKNGLPMMEFIYSLALTAAIGMNDLGAGMTAFVAFLMYIAFNVCDREYRLFFKTFFYLFIILSIVLAALKHMIGGY